MQHKLKTWPEYFQAVKRKDKSFEVRENDRNFNVGDTLLLEEWDNTTKTYTGDSIEVCVSYILHGGSFGLAENIVVMAIQDSYTEVEKTAIYMFQNDSKLEAIKYLMNETNRGLKDAKDFLDHHSKLNHEQ